MGYRSGAVIPPRTYALRGLFARFEKPDNFGKGS